MRFVEREIIFLNENEMNIWVQYDQLLDSIRRGSSNIGTQRLVEEIQDLIFDLADYIDEEEN